MCLKNCLIILWVYIMYVLGLWIFLSGYLLKRIVIYENSTHIVNIGSDINCSDITSLHTVRDNVNLYFDSHSVITHKNHLRRFDKAVIIIVDALRYDFAKSTDDTSSHNEYYLNKIPILDFMVQHYPYNAAVLELSADPPTTTLQRLKGLTTGSFPTFIDISRNFAGSEIEEDNLIRQMKMSKKNIVFMGDDTWDSIYPNHFFKSLSYPSFNVKDLDTVDNGILKHIYKELEQNTYDILIAHFLGIDHCGHRYGPKHPEMSRKLNQVNQILEKVMSMLYNDTILVVVGDHGMTDSGEHGGDSDKEVSTTLFLYSPSKFIFNESIHNSSHVSQIDIVPTLSLLLGLPIPFSNLGSVIPFLFSVGSYNSHCFSEHLDPLVGSSLALAENALQIFQYLKAYSFASSEFEKSFVIAAEERLKRISFLWSNVTSDHLESIRILEDIQSSYKKYIRNMHNIFKQKWATFKNEYIVVGLLILCFTVMCNFQLSEQVEFKYFITLSIIFIILQSVVCLFWSFIVWLPFCLIISSMILKLFYNAIIHCIPGLLTFPTVVLVISGLCAFSNSFVVHEDRISLFLLQSLLLYRFYPCLSIFKSYFPLNKYNVNKKGIKAKCSGFTVLMLPLILLFLLCSVRLGSLFYKCREEQIHCEPSDLTTSIEKLDSPQSYKLWRLFISLFSVVIPGVMFNFKSSAKLYNATTCCIKYGIFLVCICICLKWWLGIVSPEAVDRILQGNEVALTQSAAFISICMCLVILAFPVLSEKPWTVASKEIFGESFQFLLFIILQLLSLIAGDAFSPAIILMGLSVLFYCMLMDSSPQACDFQWTDVIIWTFLCRHGFYATGHQATFSSIHWGAAFLLSHKEIQSYILPGALVLVNSFSSQIFHGLALPTIAIYSRPNACTSVSILRLHLKYLACLGAKLLCHVIASAVLRRHLMNWKIFTPRLVYEVLSIIFSMMAISVGHYFIIAVSSHYYSCIRMNLKHVFSGTSD